jgi:hypothetical protein
MAKKHIYMIVFVLAGAGGYFLWATSKKHLAEIIFKSGGASNMTNLMNMEKPFLEAWAKACKKTERTFKFGSKEYYTKGGKAVL